MKWIIPLFISFSAYGNYIPLCRFDHVSKPAFGIYLKKDTCENNAGCSCVIAPRDLNYTYYEKINDVLVINATSKATHDAQIAADAAAQVAMDAAKKAQQCGKDVKAFMLVRNAPKNLSATQVDKFYNDSDLKMIQDQLTGGSLDSARVKMVAYSPDDDPVTDADKTAMIAKLDGCK